MTIRWSDRAIDRIRAIHDFIAEESVSGAISVVRNIFESVERLRAFPRSGRIVPEYEYSELREVIASPYRILYRIIDDKIEIVNVLHSHQNL